MSTFVWSLTAIRLAREQDNVSVQDVLLALNDFNAWVDDQRRKLVDKGASQDVLNDLTEKAELIRTLVLAYLAAGTENIQSVKIETLKTKHNLFRVVRVRCAFKGYSGTKVMQRDTQGRADILNMVDRDDSGPLEQLGTRNDYQSVGTFTFGEAETAKSRAIWSHGSCRSSTSRKKCSASIPTMQIS